VRLIHRTRERSASLQERDAYEHSYGTTVDHVDIVRVEPAVRPEIAIEEESAQAHVTTKELKAQFEERLAGRRRHRARRT